MKTIKRKFKLLILILVVVLTFTGCFNYKEVNTVTFTTSCIFDVADNGDVLIYLDCARPYRNTNESSDKGKRIIYKGTGKTALEAIRDVNMASSYKINFTQNRAIIFTERAAKIGIEKYLSLINIDQEFQIKPYMFVYFGDVDALISVSSSDEEYLGLFLNELVQKNKANPRRIVTNVNDFLVESKIGSNYAMIGGLQLRKDATDERVELSGGVLMKGSSMVERISIEDGMSYNFFTDNISTGTLEVKNPQLNEGFITLEILKSNTKTNVEYDGNRVKLTKKIKVKTSIAETQGRFITSREAIKTIEETEEENIREYLYNFFNKFSNRNMDILKVERLLEMKYPKLVVENVLSKIDLDIDVDLEIEGSGRVENNFF